jgi:hypothetical protein
MKVKEFLVKSAKQSGVELKFDGLVKMTGRFNFKVAKKPEDIVGFDYILFWKGDYFKFYAANPPLIGMTPPFKMRPVLGFESFNDFKIDYKEAIRIFNSGNWGTSFTLIELYKPLVHPEAKEPFWYFLSNLGIQVIIGANTGNVKEVVVEEMMAI